MASAPAGGDGDVDMDPASNSGSDSDVDGEAHDFTADGVLPEALTSLHTVKQHQNAQSSWQRIAIWCPASLAWLRSAAAPKSLHFLHQADPGAQDSNGRGAQHDPGTVGSTRPGAQDSDGRGAEHDHLHGVLPPPRFVVILAELGSC